jgi:hypothetical protein
VLCICNIEITQMQQARFVYGHQQTLSEKVPLTAYTTQYRIQRFAYKGHSARIIRRIILYRLGS